jgi:AraC-like DNA-binding protein
MKKDRQPQVEFMKDGFKGQRMVYVPGAVKKRILEDPRIRDLYITHMGIFPEALGHLRIRPRGSSQYILIYCVKGKGWIETRGIRHHLSANQLFVIPPNVPCSYGADLHRPWTNYWIHFSGEQAHLHSPPTDRVVNLPPSEENRIEERLLLFEEILQNVEHYYQPEKLIYANLCLKYFMASIRYLDIHRSRRQETGNRLLNHLINYMKTHLHEKLRVEDLADYCSCSSSNIYKLFRKHLGKSPMDYHAHLKMERARRYLAHTDLKVKDIGLRLGYEDPYYFSRSFSKYTGISPAGFRKEEET